jgi:hypothetical protein
MAREAPSRGDRFVHGLLVCFEVFLVLRWMMLEKVLGVVAWRGGGQLCLATMPSRGVDMDELACPLL